MSVDARAKLQNYKNGSSSSEKKGQHNVVIPYAPGVRNPGPLYTLQYVDRNWFIPRTKF